MKKSILFFMLYQLILLPIFGWNNNNKYDFYFDLYFKYPNSTKEIYVGCGSFINEKFTISSEKDYNYLQPISVETISNDLQFTFMQSLFSLRGVPVFREYEYGSSYSIILKQSDLIHFTENSRINKQNKIIIDSMSYNNSFCPALIICNNLRIRESPNISASTRVIGKLNKWEKVTVIECTKTKDNIENLNYPWYKIKLENGKEGWVFGGFAKIYFNEEDLKMLYSSFEKDGSEYTNQYLTPDNS